MGAKPRAADLSRVPSLKHLERKSQDTPPSQEPAPQDPTPEPERTSKTRSKVISSVERNMKTESGTIESPPSWLTRHWTYPKRESMSPPSVLLLDVFKLTHPLIEVSLPPSLLFPFFFSSFSSFSIYPSLIDFLSTNYSCLVHPFLVWT